jgi:cytochrome c-type biogenesis protein CcmH/NrfG
MISTIRKLTLVFGLIFLIAVGMNSAIVQRSLADPQTQTPASREDAYRANNLGVALLEQFKYKEGADAFKRALQLNPKLALARINLSIALYNVPDLVGAQREAQAAMALAPNAPQPHYILGLIAKTQARYDDAIGPFQQVLKIDPNDVGSNVNLGQIYSQQKKYTEAIAVFRIALAVEPYNSTALYNLGTALIRSGQREEGQRVIQRFQEFRTRGSGSSLGNNYLEQGRYADAVASTGIESDLVDRTTPSVAFTDATAESFPGAPSISKAVASSMLGGRFRSSELNDDKRRSIVASLGGGATLFDFDADGDLDLFWTTATDQYLYRNDDGKFTEITGTTGALNAKSPSLNVGSVAGDYDNDGRSDLFVIRNGELALYHNDGGGKFADVRVAAGIPAYPYLPGAVAFVDVDHDGDLDVLIAGLADLTKTPKVEEPIFPTDFDGAPNMLLRNDGDGKFTDITAAAKLNKVGHAVAIVPTDFNNRRDIDLLIVDYGMPPALFSNQRDGTFQNVAMPALPGTATWTCVGAGDLNKDGYTDFFFGRSNGVGVFALSDGRENFKTINAPETSTNASAAQIVDYDNDGLLDCVVLTDKGLVVLRNLGSGWDDVTASSVKPELVADKPSNSRLLALADFNKDGNTDVLFLSSSGQLRVGRNGGSGANHSLRVNLDGKVSNRSGVGSKLEVRAGSLVQKLESYSAWPAPAPADLTFGLGKRDSVDAVRILWPAGIVQAETEIPKPAAKSILAVLNVIELDRKPSSCPFLYTWNGERFEFITDFMGGGEMGYLEEPGRHNQPDPVEYVRIRSDQLKERRGFYDLRVTNELEEALYADRFQLIAVDHPGELAVYPNEGMTDPPRPFQIFVTRGSHSPLSAVDDHGTDVLDRITKLDRRYPDDFKLDRIRGYAELHTLTMKLANSGIEGSSTVSRAHKESSADDKLLLLLTGWTDYAWSSDNVAASQGKKAMMLPALQVKDGNGKWQTVIEDIGIPVGRPQTVTVDLTGKFLSDSREVRIVTNMRIYWDQILVGTSDNRPLIKVSRIDPLRSELHWRGFSKEITPDGREPLGYDYQAVSFTSPWKVMTGHYTREGDVRELLTRTDDMFVIARPGDEITLTFDAKSLPAVALGWTRTFLLYSDGFSKEMDINSASPDQVYPLPFHGMSKYPYSIPESYPFTPERLAYIGRYNTRLVASPVTSIDTELVLRSQSAFRK